MIKCGNRECKFHNKSGVYTPCQHSDFPSTKITRYVNLCGNVKYVSAKDNKKE